MNGLPWRALLAVLLGAGACAPDAQQATEVMLEIDAEPSVRARLDTLCIKIEGGQSSQDLDPRWEPTTPLKNPELPKRVGLVPPSTSASYWSLS
jgi:hypothetical protein